ncbi:hypothetical protein BJF93_10255 [Xaviernesmea oryzae]|uniref:DUF945 domain-containing protein n=1 Tax=Xaviernesmea oryzae TaxID=464029 RepID=A0A1Q9AWZ8_9HYPH|nr:hypothetical protein [Xaviernesmea oryzae]OLP59964.1 hypothetical protein BJF93_10255 [Xaviernesmea oryzae]SEK42754.1 hypothetical protein SAMN04487976_102160 [Xaviernesmea oryzae]
MILSRPTRLTPARPRAAAGVLLAGVALIALSGPAFALDGTDMVRKLNAAYSPSGGSIGYQSIAVDGDTVTLKGASLNPLNEPPVALGDIAFEGVKEKDGGAYYVETVSFQDVDMAKDETRITARNLAIGGLQIPAIATGNSLDNILFYQTAASGPIEITVKGRQVFSANAMESNVSRKDGDKGLEFDASVTGIKADLATVEDPQSRATISQLGLSQLNGEMSMEGEWEVATGAFSLDDAEIDFDKVGKLSLTLGLSGYTPTFMNAMQQAIKAAEENPNKEQANQALGLSMLGLAQQLTFTTAEIRFDDDSLTKRLLDYFGAQQKVSGKQLAESLKGLAPLMVAQLNIPELQNQISNAVNTYLSDPKSFTISANPDKPVPFPMIAGAAMGAPNSIPTMLGVTVEANTGD